MELLGFHSTIDRSMSMQHYLPTRDFQYYDFLTREDPLCRFLIRFANNGFWI